MPTPPSGPRISRRRVLGLALGTAAAGLVRFPDRASAQNPLVRTTLPNGLLVVAEERRSADTVAVRITARAGARDTAEVPGLALLTSRVMFQGTARFPSETNLQRAAALVGGTLERGTAAEFSLISSVVPSFEADVAFDLLSDIATSPLFTQDSIDRQKRIALQDLTQQRASASGLIQELFQTALFAGHPLAAPVIGTPETIEAITRDALVSTRGRLWGAANLVLTVVGNISTDDAIAKAQSFFAGLPSGASNQRFSSRPEARNLPTTVRGQAGQQQAQLRIGFLAPPQRDADSYPFLLLNGITTGSSGLIFRELRSDRQLAYSADSAYIRYQDSGAWLAAAGVDPQNVDAAIDATFSVIRRVREFRISPGAIAGLTGQIEGLRALADETNAARADRLAGQQLLGGETTEELLARLSEVTPADVQRVARDYLQPERALIAIVAPPGRGVLPGSNTSQEANHVGDQLL